MATPTPAECGEWLGIPQDKLPSLIEHPGVSRALIHVRTAHEQWFENKDFAATMRDAGLVPEQVFARHDLPVVDPDGLDIKKLELELELGHRLGEPKTVRVEDVSPEGKENRLIHGIESTLNLLDGALKEDENGNANAARRRVLQAKECLMQTLNRDWTPSR